MTNEKPLYMPSLGSPLAPYITDYIERKRTLHFKFNTEAFFLGKFDQHCCAVGLASPIVTKELLDGWNRTFAGENETNRNLRARTIRSFCSFMHQCGCEVPHKFHPLPMPSRTFKPHIFSQQELYSLFNAADESNRVKRTVSPVKHLVMPIMLRTIYCCGLRVSEATHLKITDVDIADGTASIKDSKNNCDRMVVFSESLANLLDSYRSRKEILSFGSEYFFPAPDRGHYSNAAVYSNFRESLFYAGISHGGRGKGPRLHDLRHSFAVHALSRWQRSGKDIYVCLPILSAYMGHQNLYETQKYLQLVPESYEELTDSYRAKFSHMFPKV